MKRLVVGVLQFGLVAVSRSVAAVPDQARASIDRTIGGKGAYIADEGVYKVIFHREETNVLVDQLRLPLSFGLNSWAAFASDVHHEAMLTGQFAVFEDEVNPVLTAALDAGLEVTGLAIPFSLKGRVH